MGYVILIYCIYKVMQDYDVLNTQSVIFNACFVCLSPNC